MKKLLLVVLLIAAAIYAFNLRFDLESGKAQNGSYQLVVVDTSTGAVHRLIGK